jgi:outer membrane protein TolC
MYRPLGTITLPIWRDKLAAQIAEAQANKRAAEARLTAEQIALAVEFAEKSYTYREATRNLVLLREQLLPKAKRSLELARIGYLSGQLDFFNLSDSERTLLQFELDEVGALTQRELALTDLSLTLLGRAAPNSMSRSPKTMRDAKASGSMNRSMTPASGVAPGMK